MDNVLKEREKDIKKVLLDILWINLFVAGLKMYLGYKFRYLSVASSALDSFFDSSSNILGLITITYAYKGADDKHHYGRYKYETLGSLLIAGFLIFSSIQMGVGLFDYLGNKQNRGVFSIIPILGILLSIVINYFVAVYEKKKGTQLSSSLLLADAQHTRGDFIMGFGVLSSILLSKFGFWMVDFGVGVIITLYVFYLAIRIVMDNIPHLLDTSPKIEKELFKSVETIPEIKNIHKFRARGNQNCMFVDFHLLLTNTLSLREAHEIGHKAEDLIRNLLKGYAQKVDVTVHIEPYEKHHKDPR
jgi:cation diffusion facilitator family transporter